MMRNSPLRRLAAYTLPVLAILALAAALLWLPSTDPAQAQDDPAGPKITAGPTIISNPQNGDTYRAGETITITLAYSEAVTVNGKPRLRLMIGEQRRWAGYDHTGADDATLAFSHVVKSDDADADGITIRKNQLKLNGGTIVDADGNAANLNHRALRRQGGHKVDGAPDQPEPEPTPTPAPANNEPQFAAGSAARSVAELSLPGAAVGAPVAATDSDGDALTYALAGADAGSFNLDAASGQISVRDALDYEAKARYAVTVTVHDGKNAAGEADASVDDTITVAVTVLNVDEPGAVALDTAEPQVGTGLTATLSDPDGGVTGLAWAWERSPHGSEWTGSQTTTPADTTGSIDPPPANGWTAIAGATGAAYTPVDADAGQYLRATASYADGEGAGKSAQAATSDTVAALPAEPNNEPQFAGGSAARSVAELSLPGAAVGTPVAATDDDDGDALTYGLAGADAGSFNLDTASGQISVRDALDYEARASYAVTVTVHDGKNAAGEADESVDDTITVAVTVLNVDEPGAVALDTAEPQVGTGLTATLSDPDGGVTGLAWAWERSPHGSEWTGSQTTTPADTTGSIDPPPANGWTAIAGATGAAYTPVDADAGQYLRATASYADGEGAGKSAQAATSDTVAALPAEPNNEPQFADEMTVRAVAELSRAGVAIGAPVAATDADGDALTYGLAGPDAGAFNLDPASGQIQVKNALNYEGRACYLVTVTVHDGKNAAGRADASVDDTISVAIILLNVDEPGRVLLGSPFKVGRKWYPYMSDPDGGVTGVILSWERSPTPTGPWTAIEGVPPGDTYTPVEADEGQYLQATAFYDDAEGSGKVARSNWNTIHGTANYDWYVMSR